MPDAPGANSGENGNLPAGSPPANQVPGQTVAAPGAAQTPSTVPFHENPEIQDYINRTVENRLQDILAKINQSQPRPAEPGSDPLELIAKEFVDEKIASEEVAKPLVQKLVRIVRHAMKPVAEKQEQYELLGKFAQVFAEHKEDAEKLAPKMREIFNSLTETERTFVLNSADGAEYLFNRAYREANKHALPPSARTSAGNPPAMASSPGAKVGGGNALIQKALEAKSKGDRRGYEEIMAQLARG